MKRASLALLCCLFVISARAQAPATTEAAVKQCFLYYIKPAERLKTASDWTPKDQELGGLHFAYLQRAVAEGKATLVGRTMVEGPDLMGLAVFYAKDQAEADAFVKNDPAIHGGVFVGKAIPFKVVLEAGK